MDLGPGARLRLSAADEYTHPVEAARNFNESMYINLFDHAQRTGGWFRVGNRPNEGHAEMSCCLHFPDGSAAFMFRRPAIRHNRRLAAGGMAFEVVRPLEHLRVTYDGQACLLKDPQDMLDPQQAFRRNPLLPCRLVMDFRGISPVFGGEKVDEQGQPVPEAADEAFARAHYEQHMRGTGTVQLGDRRYSLNGLGLRDHSWGPRYWQNLHWYRWLPMAFRDDFAINVAIVQMASGRRHAWGMVLRRGAGGRKDYGPVIDATLHSTLDARRQAVAQVVTLRTAERSYTVTGRALSLVPLRNRRARPDGSLLHTRITEAMTEYRCDGHVGYGMAEYLDQLVDGVPVGLHC